MAQCIKDYIIQRAETIYNNSDALAGRCLAPGQVQSLLEIRSSQPGIPRMGWGNGFSSN